jgi:hypothetical protein
MMSIAVPARVFAVMLLTRRLVVALVRADVSSIVAVAVDGVVALIGYESPAVNPEFIYALAVPLVLADVVYWISM